ncbi:hypothetical protein BJ138DRAFT_185696 [Hygrophoropsis aurantiaca]|uniref:Uncharacterized protein n=1 Tax=Hygrophoropsis aurantiaca TaxID=72124 RepID=A0ACB8A9Q7_9AGAM|nr:hypothetical protein BJ138DRAFT_185696 [Hygrophoropsis aurantiaca]
MDSFISLAKKGYEAYSESQSSDVNKTGGQEYNRPSNSNDDQYEGGGGRPHFDHEDAGRQAEEHAPGAGSFVSSALNHIKSHPQQQPDEDEVVQAHEKAYNQGSTSGLSSGSLGGAAALKIFQQFGGGGKSNNELIGLAIGEATKLMGGSGDQGGAANGAAAVMMKLVMQKEMGNFIGGGSSGGMSSMMKLASNFM